MIGTVTVTTEPTVEPVLTNVEIKNHLRIDHNDDDDLLDGLIVAARKYFEEATRRSLITQTLKLTLESWPSNGIICLHKPPIQSVTDIKYLDEDGNESTFSASNYILDTVNNRVVLATNATWPTGTLYPTGAIRVTYVAGYGAAGASVPKQMVQCIKMLVGHWYENREGVMVGGIPRNVPFAINSLIYLNRAY